MSSCLWSILLSLGNGLLPFSHGVISRQCTRTSLSWAVVMPFPTPEIALPLVAPLYSVCAPLSLTTVLHHHLLALLTSQAGWTLHGGRWTILPAILTNSLLTYRLARSRA